MALADKNSESLYDKTGSGKKRLSDAKQSEISASFASGIISEFPESPDAVAGMLYMIQKMQEDIDELRRYVTNEATGSAISELSGSIKVTLPSALSKSTPSGHLYVLTEKDGTKTIKSA